MFFAEEVVFVFAAFPEFVLQRLFEVLHIEAEGDAIAAEGAGHFELLEVVDAEEVGDRVEDAVAHVLYEFGHVLLLAVGEGLHDDFDAFGVFVLEDGDGAEEVVDAFLDEGEVAREHFFEDFAFLFDGPARIAAHSNYNIARLLVEVRLWVILKKV